MTRGRPGVFAGSWDPPWGATDYLTSSRLLGRGGNPASSSYLPSPLTILDTMDAPSLLAPVPLTIDNDGNIYTGDFEDGSGSAGACLFELDSGGTLAL